MSGEALVVVALAFRACMEPLCCWEVRLDDGLVYRGEQGAEASFEIPRQGQYFEARGALGTCSDPGVWSDWRQFEWLHSTDIDADGVISSADVSALSSNLGQTPEASDYFYCLQPDGGVVADPPSPPTPPTPPTPPAESTPPALEEIATGGSSAASVVATASALGAASEGLYLAAVVSKPDTEVTSVSGLGLVWTPVRSQCAGRRQTGVSVWQASGEPTGDGIVNATLSSAPLETVIAASRYSGSAVVGSVVSGNTLGVSGSCSGGSDANAYALELDTTEADSLVHVWVATRLREHFPGSGFAEWLEIHQGPFGGNQAGLALTEHAAETATRVDVSGSFSSSVDWAVVAAEIRRPVAPE